MTIKHTLLCFTSVRITVIYTHSVYPYHTHLTYIHYINDSIHLSSSLTFYINIIGALPLQAIEVMTLRDSTYYNSLGLQSQFLLHLIVDV